MFKLTKFTLDNGLRVVHYEDKNAPMVILNTLYDVGSKDETIDKTGFAHLFEHLMFGGTPAVPSFDEPIQKAGGENNAWTSADLTNYYVVLPANNAEIAFWLESDRMNGLSFSQKSLDVQRHVVCEEFKQRCLNQPYGNLHHYIRKLCFGTHPYGWPTIGLELSHIENASLDEVKSFFYSHYAPNNAILVVAGNISLEETKRLVHKWYDSIPYREIKKRSIPSVPKQEKEQYLEVEENVPTTCFFRMYHTGGRFDNDYWTSDVLSDVLSNGTSSRVHQRLVKEKKIFTSASAYISGDIETGLFYLTGKLCDGITYSNADEAFEELIDEVRNELVSDYEIQKLRNKFESRQITDSMVLMDLASDLAYYELLGDANQINQLTQRYNEVTPQMLRDFTLNTFKRENCSTLFYKAKK
ncbi:MAG: insulinase family protein [Paludibacteraceae bacterium]|nr:insulinase family protein [Paludibacteraceae bacterium]